MQEKELLLREGMRILGLQVDKGQKLRGHIAPRGQPAHAAWLPAAAGLLRPPPAAPVPVPARTTPVQDGAYWGSWFLTHWAGMAASGALCALVGLYPFAHSRRAAALGAGRGQGCCGVAGGRAAAAGP